MAQKDRLRMRIAMEAARIMAEEGIHEHGLAKKKAAARIGVPECRNLPRTEEIEAALTEHHRLFGTFEQPRRIARLRKLALEAMRFLAEFSPLLVGGVWDGGAGKFSPIRLHLFPSTAEEVMRKLLDCKIPFEEKSHPWAQEGEPLADYPGLQFYVDDTRVELLLLPSEMKGRSLRKKGGRLNGGTLKEVEMLIRQEDVFESGPRR
ncbi:MAG: hypothetical protein PHE55_11640 [Methylococcaceae bacterium]|nr:hypothetical protein [Methylococcaceae bacterium]